MKAFLAGKMRQTTNGRLVACKFMPRWSPRWIKQSVEYLIKLKPMAIGMTRLFCSWQITGHRQIQCLLVRLQILESAATSCTRKQKMAATFELEMIHLLCQEEKRPIKVMVAAGPTYPTPHLNYLNYGPMKAELPPHLWLTGQMENFAPERFLSSHSN